MTHKDVKRITQFDVFNAMPEGSIDIFMHQAGGRQIGKGKDKKAIIEILVDNDTFQDFAFQKTYGEAKSGKNKKYFIMYAVDAELYEQTRLSIEKSKK